MLVGLNYAIASFGALVAGILFNFKTQGALVFGNSDNRLLWRFAVCWLAIYVVNVSLIGKFIALGIDKFVAGLLPIPWTISALLFRAAISRLRALDSCRLSRRSDSTRS